MIRDDARSRSLRTTVLVLTLLSIGLAAAGAAPATAASDPAVVESAVAYDADGDGGAETVEIVLNRSIASENLTATVDRPGEVGVSDVSVATPGANAVEVTLDAGVTPNQHLAVTLRDGSTRIATATDVPVTSTAVREGAGDVPVFRGAPIAIVADEANQEIEIDGGSLDVLSSTGDHSRVYYYDTGNLDTGQEYTVEFAGASDGSTNFTVRSLGLSAEATADTFTADEEVAADLSANTNGNVVAELRDSSDDVVASEVVTLVGGKTTTVSFPSQAVGNYTISVTHNATGNTVSTDRIELTTVPVRTVAFEDGYVSEERGDVATIPITLDETDEATLLIGSQSVNYWIAAEVTDDSGDGRVTVRFDTALAGTHDEGNTVLSVADEDDEITVLDEGGAFADVTNTDPTPEARLSFHQYNMNLTEGHAGYTDPDDVGTLAVTEPAVRDVSVGALPASENVDTLTTDDLTGVANWSTSSIAEHDHPVVRIRSGGLERWLATAEDPLASLDDDVGLEVTVVQTEGDNLVNSVPREIDLASNATLVTGPGDETVYLVLESVPATETDGQAWAVDVSVAQESSSGESQDAPDAEYEVVDRTAVVGTTGGQLILEPTNDSVVTGRTTIAPGSEVTITVRSADPDEPFYRQVTGSVASNGSITATVDLSGVSAGTPFTVTLRDPETGAAFAGADSIEGTVATVPDPVVENGGVPLDPDDDGLYEDVNGNGRQDIADAVDLFQHRESVDPAFFDFNDSGGMEIGDAVVLFRENVAA